MNDNAAYMPLLARINSLVKLSDEEQQAILSLPIQEKKYGVREDIVHEGDRPTKSFYIREGVVCVNKTTRAGRRQIAAIHIAGDIPDLQSLHLEVMDISITTFTPCTLEYMRHEDIRTLCRSHPRVADVLWRETLVDAAIYREWLTNAGQRDAYTRVAHFICEMIARHRTVGLAEEDENGISISWPITQIELGDALGMSNVHINRSLQALRERGLIDLKKRTLIVPSISRLEEAGEFDATYLHLRST
jgi:CRP-like cAMP-binding protein